MLTRIDHVMICVPELSAGIEAYRRHPYRRALAEPVNMPAAGHTMPSRFTERTTWSC